MDPIANLAEQLQIARELADPPHGDNSCPECGTSFDRQDRAERLAELVLALDSWRRAGGFDPYAS